MDEVCYICGADYSHLFMDEFYPLCDNITCEQILIEMLNEELRKLNDERIEQVTEEFSVKNHLV